MFGTMKKALVVAAVAGLGAVAPSVASADTWRANTSVIGTFPGVSVAGGGSLSYTIPLGGGATATTTCGVEVTADLYNLSGVAHGSVTSFAVPVPADCTVTSSPTGVIGACQVTAVTATSTTSNPWTIDTTGTSVTVNGVNFTNTYAAAPGGNPCALTGSKVITGNVTGSWSNPGTLSFSGATGLTVNPGSLPATVNGSVFVGGEAGETITLL